MYGGAFSPTLYACRAFLIQHSHEPPECGVVFAAFKGHDSPLRHRATLASCAFGGHAIWWCVEAMNERGGAVASCRLRRHPRDRDPSREVDIP